MRAKTKHGLLIVVGLGILVSGCTREKRPAVRGTPPPEPVTQQSGPQVMPRYHALVIGISDYEKFGAEGWDSLVTARGDAEAVADVLAKKYGFNVTRLLDREATRAHIIQAMDDLVNLTPDDAVLIYFAGHGQYDESLGEGYWIPADGKKTDGKRSAKADWIWNSMLTKIIAASRARHVLVVADSCYGGSLFRGGATPVLEEDFQWYARAIRAPSRYLITSGDLEPVMDSGERHSVFAQELLNFLEHTDRLVFSASDIGFALREKVSTLTGQLVRMGPMAVSTHAGGEFVFVARNASVEWPEEEKRLASVSPHRGVNAPDEKSSGGEPPASKVQLMQDAVLMKQQGAEQSAGQIASSLLSSHAEDGLVKAIAAFVRDDNREKERSEIRELVDRIEKNAASKAQGESSGQDLYARPRVLACFGPSSTDASAETESLAHLARICLRARIETHASFRVVEREALEDLLAELNIGTSPLADKDAGLAIGKLLPASLMLLGDIIPRGQGLDVYVRLVDTETTRILASFTAHAENRDQLPDVCERLADDIVRKAQEMKPLTARVLQERDGLLDAGLGNFHGIDTGMTFALIERAGTDSKPTASPRKKKVGTAQAVAIGDMQSEFAPAWSDASSVHPAGSLWLEESTGPAAAQ
ncbi:MAG: caspase family protein [bacterium]